MSKSVENLTIICPACGYSFRVKDLNKKKIKCPACGYEFKRRLFRPEKSDFDQPII